MVIGMDRRSAPVELRERYWIAESQRFEILGQLAKAEGIDEVIVLATCNCTEFILWANDVTLAANSIMRLLAARYGLKLDEWMRFYRLLDGPALFHIFRVVAGLDFLALGEPEIVSQFQAAWQQAQEAGACGRCLDAVMQKALMVSKRVRSETEMGRAAAEVEKIVHAEAHNFWRELAAQRVVPTIIALRTRLDEICRQELETFRQENGPFTQDQDEMLTAVMSRMTQRITGSLARELKKLPEQMEQEQMAAIVQRLFHLQTPEKALAGTTS